jgi:3-deoxy-D-manno-octulosonic-acid transferase
MRWLYVFLIYLIAPLLWAHLWLKGRRNVEYRRRMPERFGYVPAPAAPVAVWIHAVSVGETLAALPLIRALVRRHGRRRVWVTSGTPTGSARVAATLGDDVLHSYAPYDIPHVVRRFVGTVKPQKVLIIETEIWPSLFGTLRARRIPLMIVNARISDRSLRRYRRLRRFAREVLGGVSCVAAQSEQDAARFSELGAPRVVVTGNLKFDAEPDLAQVEQGRALRQRVGTSRPVWIAASTHAGEELAALQAHRALLQQAPQALLVLVPRHPERFGEVAAEIARQGLVSARRSQDLDAAASAQVLLGDSMGEMWMYLAAADIAFVGGSLAAVGGHNVLEPAALGMPVLFGPHMQNFLAAGDVLLTTGAARRVVSAADLAQALSLLVEDSAQRAAMARAGQDVVNRNRGSLQRLLHQIFAC